MLDVRISELLLIFHNEAHCVTHLFSLPAESLQGNKKLTWFPQQCTSPLHMDYFIQLCLAFES